MNNPACFTSKNEHHNTPSGIVQKCVLIFGRTVGLDPCSNATSIVGADTEWIYEKDGDSLTRSWKGKGPIYVNPPYGRGVTEWSGVVREWLNLCTFYGRTESVIALVPSRTDTVAWQDRIFPTANQVCFLNHRLTFLGQPDPAPFPSALVLWGPNSSVNERFYKVLAKDGTCLNLRHLRVCSNSRYLTQISESGQPVTEV